MNNTELDRIESLIQTLKYECYTSHIPMIAIIQYEKKGRPIILAESISPALVNNDFSSPVFYNIQNILTGNFKTVPISSSDEDYFEW